MYLVDCCRAGLLMMLQSQSKMRASLLISMAGRFGSAMSLGHECCAIVRTPLG
jgi:hypothetical protein